MISLNTTLMTRTSRVVIIAAALSASGCAQLLTPLGAENYDCNRKENPASPYCHSFRAVADGTNTPIPDSRYDAAVKLEDADRMNGIAPSAPAISDSNAQRPQRFDELPEAQRRAALAPRPPGPLAPPDGSPVRVAPLVQRTWIKRHVEQGDRLVGSTYLYKEVTRGHWQGFAEAPAGSDPVRGPIKPHLPSEDDASGFRAATGAVNKGAGSILSRVKSSLSQPGLATPAGEVVAPPIDGASMPQ